MARKKFPTWKRIVLSCGCGFSVGSDVNPASVDKCPRCRVKVTATEEQPVPIPVVESPPLVIVPPTGGQALLPI